MITKSSSWSQVARMIAALNHEKPNTVRQRLKEWDQEAQAKTGENRRSLEVSSCFAPLCAGVIKLLPPTTRQIGLALDGTSIGNRFTVRSINVLLAGCGIPIGWCIVKATAAGSWQPHWQKFIAQFQEVMPKSWLVVVSADRGLYADWLYQLIVSVDWHRFQRINQGWHCSSPTTTDMATTSRCGCDPWTILVRSSCLFKNQSTGIYLAGRMGC